MAQTLLGRRYRYLLEVRGLILAPSAHEERYLLRLAGGDIALDRHPRCIRDALLIAAELYGPGEGEHGEIAALCARRDELDAPLSEPRTIEWQPSADSGATLNPGKWVRLDAWLEDQFLLDDAVALRYEREGS